MKLLIASLLILSFTGCTIHKQYQLRGTVTEIGQPVTGNFCAHGIVNLAVAPGISSMFEFDGTLDLKPGDPVSATIVEDMPFLGCRSLKVIAVVMDKDAL